MTLTITDTREMFDTMVEYHNGTTAFMDFDEVQDAEDMLTASLPASFAPAIAEWAEHYRNTLYYFLKDQAADEFYEGDDDNAMDFDFE